MQLKTASEEPGHTAHSIKYLSTGPESFSVDISNLDEGLESLSLVCALESDFGKLEERRKLKIKMHVKLKEGRPGVRGRARTLNCTLPVTWVSPGEFRRL